MYIYIYIYMCVVRRVKRTSHTTQQQRTPITTISYEDAQHLWLHDVIRMVSQV